MRSPKQVQEFLYGTLKLAPMGTSTDADTLEGLPSHPAVKELKAYRLVQKQLSTFVVPLREKADADGRVRTTFKLHGTTTGRLASSKPNIQNIPRDKNIRGQFIAAPGCALLDVDLAQAELRVLACLSQDEVMINIFRSGISLHDEVAEFLFGKGFNKEQKMIAKNINFGIIYGITSSGLKDQIMLGAMMLGSEFTVTMKQAQEWIDGWMRRFPQAAAFIERCRLAPLKGQTLVSAFGRKRRFGVVTRDKLSDLQNEAANFPEQSAAHDNTLLSGIRLSPEFKLDYDAKFVNEVHDALLLDIHDDMSIIVPAAIRLIETLQEIPKQWGLTAVPFVAEAEVGYAWGSTTRFDPYAYVDRLEQLQGMTHVEAMQA